MTDYEERFIERDADVFVPLCNSCAHLERSESSLGTCRAFPRGIPKEIFLGKADHRKPFPGDHGIRFEPLEG